MRRYLGRWWFWSAVTLLLLGLLGGAALYIGFGLSNRDRVTMSHIGRLKLGMDEVQVRRILGEEPIVILCSNETRWKRVDPSWSAKEWQGKSIAISILFDSDGRLRDWTAHVTSGKLDWTDRVVNWLDWVGF
jgi:hypothetical protein